MQTSGTGVTTCGAGIGQRLVYGCLFSDSTHEMTAFAGYRD
jgi:hypothetical protein